MAMAPSQSPPESASPALATGLAATVAQAYAEAETAILTSITATVTAALAAAAPAAVLMARAARIGADARRALDHAERQARAAVPRALAIAYGRGHGAERRVAEQTTRSLLERLAVLRGGVLQWVRQLLNRLTSAMYGPDPQPLADRVLQQAAARGITAATDTAGRQRGLVTHVEATVQHEAGQAVITGFTHRLAEDGDDLVIVTESPHPCPQCDPWEHRVLSLSGRDARRPSLATARAAGLFHPRCMHTLFRWRPGFVWPPQSLTNQPGSYEATQRQRDIERHIREWRRREAAALDDVTKAKATAKVKGWQAELERHVRAEGLKRSRQRERTDYGHTPSIRHAYGDPGPSRSPAKPTPRPKPPKPQPRREPEPALTGDEAYDAAPGRRHESIPDDAARALYGYSGGDFNWANPRLRGGPMPYGTDDAQLADTDEQIAAMRRAFKAAPALKRPVEVWRGVADPEAMFGPVGSKVGKVFRDKAFTSTSTSQARAGHFGQAQIRIRVPAGAKVIALGREEMELLLRDGARFRVVSDAMVDGKRRIELEYLP
jgi:cell division septum initiation protein DivIVA